MTLFHDCPERTALITDRLTPNSSAITLELRPELRMCRTPSGVNFALGCRAPRSIVPCPYLSAGSLAGVAHLSLLALKLLRTPSLYAARCSSALGSDTSRVRVCQYVS